MCDTSENAVVDRRLQCLSSTEKREGEETENKREEKLKKTHAGLLWINSVTAEY